MEAGGTIDEAGEAFICEEAGRGTDRRASYTLWRSQARRNVRTRNELSKHATKVACLLMMTC